MGGGVLGRGFYHSLFPESAKEVVEPQPQTPAEVAPAAEAQPPKPEPAPPATTTEGPPSGKTRQPLFDRNLGAMAVSFSQSSVYLKPVELKEGQRAVEQLAELLKLPADTLQADVRTERDFLWLKRNLDVETAKKIAKLALSGVYLVDESQRYYPLHSHASHIVGFTKDGLGLAGAEFLYDPILRGNRPLIAQYLNLPGITPEDVPAEGAATVLSVDIDLQVLLEKKIQLLLQQGAAQSASAVLIDSRSGEILAMAATPDYDPNIYWKASNSAYQNTLLSETLPLAGFTAFVKAAAEIAVGNVPPEMAARAEESERTLLPRVMKIAKGDAPIPKTQESQVWQPGIHLSPPFQWSLNFSQQGESLAAFAHKLGVDAKGSGLADSQPAVGPEPAKKETLNPVDEQSWQVQPLAILAAFAQLTNGGKAIAPHLLRGLWRLDSRTFLPTSFAAREGIGPQVSSDFVRFVETLLPPGPGDDLILESIRSMSKAGGHQPARLHEEEGERSIEDRFRFSTMTLATGRQVSDHPLALLLVVNGAKLDLNQPSPFRRAASEILSQGSGLMAKRWSNEITPPKMESDAFLYQKWSLAQSLDTRRPVVDVVVNQEMPDLVGMSLRKAMQALQGYTVKVNVQGTGRVSKQTPAAGVRLNGVSEATLELRMDN